MNANRRLEEFILKLSIRQNEHGLLDKINEPKITSYFNDLKKNENNYGSKSNNKLTCSIDKE